MDGEDRELGVRRRLGAYVERQLRRSAELDRLLTAEAGARLRPDRASPGAAEPLGERSDPGARRASGSGLPAVTILIPVHDGPDDLVECVRSLARNTTYPASLLIVDDASTDPRIDSALEWAATLEGVRVLRNASRAGFAASVRRGLFAGAGDVVVLAPDSVVGPRWLEPLVRSAHAETAAASPAAEEGAAAVRRYTYIRRGFGEDSVTLEPALARPEREGATRPRLLFVVHEGAGGAVAMTRDLMAGLADEFDCYCFSSDRLVLRLRHVEGPADELLNEWPLDRPLRLGDRSRPDYRRAFAAAIDRCDPELVHIAHLFKHTFDAPGVAAASELPVVMSFHDHYFICPTIHLLDERGGYCGGECTPGPGVCPTVRAGTLPVLKHSFVYQWREDAEATLRHADVFVAPSEYTRDIHRRFLGVTRRRPFELIEHGRDLAQRRGLAVPPEPGARVRILVPAHLDRHKGAALLAAMCELDRDRRLELHFFGDVPPPHRHLGVIHGAYERDRLADRVRDIGPAFIGVFSSTGESFSFAVTEAWAAGVPVLVTDLGAQAQRVRRHGGGFVISHDDPAAALAQVLAAADDPVGYAREASLADARDLPSVGEMAAAYADLYREVLDRRRMLAAPAAARQSPLGRGLWRATAVMPSNCFPAGRLARRWRHPALQWKLRTRFRDVACALDDDVELVLLKPAALAPEQVDALLESMRAREWQLVLECHEPPAEKLLAAARLVIVQSPALCRALSRLHPDVVVIPPMLDERLFLTGTAGPPRAARSPGVDEPVRLVYTAPRPESSVLAFLRTVLDQLSSSRELHYELDVVAGESPGAGERWYRHVQASDPGHDYPGYVRALRSMRPRWHVALAPQDEAGGGEHDLRYLEHAALGLPGVYSAIESNGAIEPDVGGLVVADDAGAWGDAVERLVTNSLLSDRIRDGAWADVTGHRLLLHGARHLLETIGRARGAASLPSRPSPGPR